MRMLLAALAIALCPHAQRSQVHSGTGSATKEGPHFGPMGSRVVLRNDGGHLEALTPRPSSWIQPDGRIYRLTVTRK